MCQAVHDAEDLLERCKLQATEAREKLQQVRGRGWPGRYQKKATQGDQEGGGLCGEKEGGDDRWDR